MSTPILTDINFRFISTKMDVDLGDGNTMQVVVKTLQLQKSYVDVADGQDLLSEWQTVPEFTAEDIEEPTEEEIEERDAAAEKAEQDAIERLELGLNKPL